MDNFWKWIWNGMKQYGRVLIEINNFKFSGIAIV